MLANSRKEFLSKISQWTLCYGHMVTRALPKRAILRCTRGWPTQVWSVC